MTCLCHAKTFLLKESASGLRQNYASTWRSEERKKISEELTDSGHGMEINELVQHFSNTFFQERNENFKLGCGCEC